MIAAIVLLAGCAGEPTTEATIAEHHHGGPQVVRATDAAALVALRTATAGLHDLDRAKAAGWSTQFPAGCFKGPAGAGDMGFHFINGGAVGTLEPSNPQLLIYEPQANGGMKLVGVEFIKPGLATDTPPELFGRSFGYNSTFGVWVLHVWVWRDNPSGLYSDWNPAVSCRYENVAIF
jgi:hypothetical protein